MLGTRSVTNSREIPSDVDGLLTWIAHHSGVIGDQKALHHVVENLSQLVLSPENTVKIGSLRYAIHILLNSLCSGVDVIKKNASLALAYLAKDPVSQANMVDIGLGFLVGALMSSDDFVKENAACALAWLAQDPAYRTEIVRSEGVHWLLAALVSEGAAKGSAACALGWLAEDSVHREVIVRSEGIRYLLEALELGGDCVKAGVVCALGWFARDSAYREVIVRAKGIDLLVDALDSEDSAGDYTKRQAACALGWLACDPAYRALIVGAGGIGLLVDALNVRNEGARENAAWALDVLSEAIEIKEQIRFEKMIAAIVPKESRTFISDLSALLQDYVAPGLLEGWGRHHKERVRVFLAQPDLSGLDNEGFLRRLGQFVGGLPASGTLRDRLNYVAQGVGLVGDLEFLMRPASSLSSLPFAAQVQAEVGPLIELRSLGVSAHVPAAL